MIETACMLYFPVGTTPEVRQTLATRYTWVWIKTAHETLDLLGNRPNLMGPAEFSGVATLAAQLKSINPRVKVGMYVGGLASPDSHHPHYECADDVDMLHASAIQPTILVPSQSPAEGGARRVKVLNYTRPETRAKMIQFWKTFLDEHNLDGVTFDTFNPAYYAAWMAQSPASPNAYGGFGLTSGGVEGAFHTEPWWFNALSTFCYQLRWELAHEGKEVWVNGLYAYPNYSGTNENHINIGPGYTRVGMFNSGLLAEYAHVMHYSTADLQANVETAQTINGMSRSSFWFVHPGAFLYSHPQYPWQQALDIHRYFLACYLLFQNPGYTYFGYNPGVMYQAYEIQNGVAVPWVFDGGADWDQDYGIALSGVNWNNGTAWRQYTKGYAIVNPTDGYVSMTLPVGTYRNWHPTGGGLVEITPTSPAMNLPPKYGMFLFKVT